MKDQTKILITAAAIVFVILSVCLFAGKSNSESARLNTDTDKTVVALTEEKEAVDGAVQRELSSAETEESSEGSPEAMTEGGTSQEETEKTEENTITEPEEEPTSVSEHQEPTTGSGNRQNQEAAETGEETTPNNIEKTHTEESGSESNREIYSSQYGIYGDTGKKKYYPCNEEKYSIVVGSVCNPDTFSEKYADVFYDEVLALSERFKKEHPFSAGSILKPYYPDIDAVYWFTGSFDERYIVLEAYDTSHKGKFFLIEFTITDNYELDTVSIRELADDEDGV